MSQVHILHRVSIPSANRESWMGSRLAEALCCHYLPYLVAYLVLLIYLQNIKYFTLLGPLPQLHPESRLPPERVHFRVSMPVQQRVD